MAIAAVLPAPAEEITWARVDHVAGGPDAVAAGPSGPVDDHETGVVRGATEVGQQSVGVRHVGGPDEHRCPRDHPAVGEPDTGQPVGLDHQRDDLASDDLDAPRSEPVAVRGRHGVGVREEDDVLGPLADQQGVLDRTGLGAQDTDRLVTHLPAVTVGTVQQVAAPPLPDSGEVRQSIVDTRRHQDPSRTQHTAAGQADGEPGLDADGPVRHQVDAVPGHLGPAGSEQVGRGHAVAGQESLHVRRGRVAGLSSVDDRDPAPGPAEHQGCAQAGRATTDDDHVVNFRLNGDHLRSGEFARGRERDNFRCRFRERLVG